MTDQTRWGIDQVQQENKAKAHEAQKEMREGRERGETVCRKRIGLGSSRDLGPNGKLNNV